MKARQKRRQRRISTAQTIASSPVRDDPLSSLQQILTEQIHAIQQPEILPELEKISVAVMRIDRRIDAMESRVVRHGALAGAVSGGLVATAISLIKAKFQGF